LQSQVPAYSRLPVPRLLLPPPAGYTQASKGTREAEIPAHLSPAASNEEPSFSGETTPSRSLRLSCLLLLLLLNNARHTTIYNYLFICLFIIRLLIYYD